MKLRNIASTLVFGVRTKPRARRLRRVRLRGPLRAVTALSGLAHRFHLYWAPVAALSCRMPIEEDCGIYAAARHVLQAHLTALLPDGPLTRLGHWREPAYLGLGVSAASGVRASPTCQARHLPFARRWKCY